MSLLCALLILPSLETIHIKSGGDTPTSSVQGCTSLDKKGEKVLCALLAFVCLHPLCLHTLARLQTIHDGGGGMSQPESCKGTSLDMSLDTSLDKKDAKGKKALFTPLCLRAQQTT